MIRRPPRSTLDRSSAASDVYKRQGLRSGGFEARFAGGAHRLQELYPRIRDVVEAVLPVSYTHLRAHETVLDLVCRLLLEKKKKSVTNAVVLVP